MLTSLGGRMNKHREFQQKNRKQKKVTNRSHWTEEYSNWFEICTGGTLHEAKTRQVNAKTG